MGGRRRTRIGRRSSRTAIPTTTYRETSAVVRISNQDVAQYVPQTETFRAPSQFFEFFKEWRMRDVVVAVRRRRPPSSVFQSASGGATVSAARQETNDIFWLPWSTTDIPNQHPRQVRSAILLTSNWSVRRIPQRCIKTEFVNMPYTTTAPNVQSTVPTWNNSSNRIVGAMVQTWRSMPWIQVDQIGNPNFTTGAVNNTGLIAAPGATAANSGFSTGLGYWGFIYVDNAAAMLNDDLEVRFRARFQFRGRKPLGDAIDVSGALNISTRGINNISYTDTVGKPGGPPTTAFYDGTDFGEIHVGHPHTEPDPGDLCDPCGA